MALRGPPENGRRNRETMRVVSAQVRCHIGDACKTVGSAYVGSNPNTCTHIAPGQTWCHLVVHTGDGSGLRYRSRSSPGPLDWRRARSKGWRRRPTGILAARGGIRRG